MRQIERYRWSDDNQAEIARGWIEKADTVGELATELGVDPAGLEVGLARYSEFVAHDADPVFGRPAMHLRPIARAPFYGLRWPGLLITTLGGLRKDGDGRVLDPEGRPIPHGSSRPATSRRVIPGSSTAEWDWPTRWASAVGQAARPRHCPSPTGRPSARCSRSPQHPRAASGSTTTVVTWLTNGLYVRTVGAVRSEAGRFGVRMSVVLTVAPTGPVASKTDNPDLPTQPEEIATAVQQAYEAGAAVAHIHLRDESDRPTANLSIARRTLDLIAERCPILVQLSTGVGLDVPFEDRAALVELRPRMATLNPCTMSFGTAEFRNPYRQVRELARRMLDLGVKPELEIYDTGHLDACLRLRDEGLLGDGPLQFSLVLGVAGGMAATPDNLVTMVRRLPEGSRWQVIAIGRANLTLTAMGLALGGNARAGLEDCLYLRKGELSPGNLPLVERAVRLVRDLDSTVANVEEAESLLALPR
ncbi:BKACE family enzyme [Amycolatopsis jiangsuensis]|uniref:Uncharacterized protein (DUF849 family) n=1 Tax=Amycolatopsis jiangsuensis TaxID=1181879 RepID=A0A840J8D9_9PSEU|nr:3-keto-5-aminohexanoate cleavage protein [Amycolatopsis jiangsuensis]MBB4689648.1 uncharacterized protein (DUF849 family) [Amycolatopsis jiangsuensis]